MRVYIGWDRREVEAYDVAVQSLRRHFPLRPEPLREDRLRAMGLLRRPVDARHPMYDINSRAYCSTDFTASRFLVPILCQKGYALFVDCDVVFYADPMELLDIIDHNKAVHVVKHNHLAEGVKMDGQIQTAYHRKNWSSVMLFNCDHPANRRLTLDDVNNRTGLDLHSFYWLHDSEIGELPTAWNWLVNEQPQPMGVKIAHFTNGGPWIPEWPGAEYDYLWENAARA